MAGTALIVGVGDGISASVAQLLAAGPASRSGSPPAGPTGSSRCRPRLTASRLPAVRDGGSGRAAVRRCRGQARHARGGALQPGPAGPGRSSSSTPRRSGNADSQRLGRFSGSTAGGATHAAAGEGADLFTGASASVKGYPRSAPFAMGKFALRAGPEHGRELAPQGIHVAHFVIDGGSEGPAAGTADCSRQHARSGRDRAELSRGAEAAAQRLELGDRAPSVGRASEMAKTLATMGEAVGALL